MVAAAEGRARATHATRATTAVRPAALCTSVAIVQPVLVSRAP